MTKSVLRVCLAAIVIILCYTYEIGFRRNCSYPSNIILCLNKRVCTQRVSQFTVNDKIYYIVNCTVKLPYSN